MRRREFLQAGVAVVGGLGAGLAPPPAGLKALVFDTFGTVVDWRTSVTREIEELAKNGLTVDGGKLADAWRAGYAPSMDRVRRGELPWNNLDRLHRMILDRILAEFHITGLSEAGTDTLNRAWHRLQPLAPNASVDVTARDFLDLAAQVGA